MVAEGLHQLRRSPIVNTPEAHNDTGHPGKLERSDEADNARVQVSRAYEQAGAGHLRSVRSCR